MAQYLGSMQIKLGADYATLQSDFGKAAMLSQRYRDDMVKQWGDFGTQLGRVIGAGAVAGVTALGALTKAAIDSADEIGKLSQKVGLSTESLSALKYQAGLAGVELAGLQTGMVKFSRAITDAAGSSKQQADTFRAMGISLRDMNGVLKPTETLLAEVADKFASYEDGAEKTAIAVRLFGKAGAELIPMMNQGAAGIRAAYEELDAYGGLISGDIARNSEEFNDNLSRLKTAAMGFANQLAKELTPALAAYSGELAKGAQRGDAFAGGAKAISDSIKVVGQVLVVTQSVLEGFVNLLAAAVDTMVGVVQIGDGLMSNLGHATMGAARLAAGDFAGAMAEFDIAGRAITEGWESGAGRIERAWISAMTGIDDAIAKSDERFKALGQSIERTVTRAQQFQNVVSGSSSDALMIGGPVDPALGAWAGHGSNGRQRAPVIDTGAGSGGAARRAEAEAKRAAAELERLAEAQRRFAAETDKINASMQGPGAQAFAEYEAGIRDANHALAEGETTLEGFSARQQALWSQYQIATETIREQQDVLDQIARDSEYERSLIRMTERQQVFERAYREATERFKANRALFKEAGVSMEAYANAAAKAARGIFDVQKQQDLINDVLREFDQQSPFERSVDAIKAMREEIERLDQPMKTAFGVARIEQLNAAIKKTQAGIVEGFAGAASQALSSIQSMSEQGTRSYQAMELAIQAMNIVQGIAAILNQGMGDPYTAIPRMVAMAALVAQLVDGIGNFAGSGFSDTARQRQEVQGTGSVLGDTKAKSESIMKAVEITADATSQLVGINRSMLVALQSLQSGIGSAANFLARGAGNADFSGFDLAVGTSYPLNAPSFIADPLGILGGKSKVTDQGIVIFGGALNDLLENIAVGAFQEVESRSWAFGSTHTREAITDVSDEFGRQFGLIMQSIADTVREGALALGILPGEIEAAMAAYSVEEIRISLKDLSAEEQQAELAAVFSEIFDGLAGAIVPFIEQFQQVGEGLGETLVRVATGVQVTQEATRYLGIAIDEADPERFAQISEGLIGAVGGIDAMISGMQSFVSSFASDAQLLSVATSELNDAFAQAGLTVPATAEGMWALMQTFDATTEEGREQIATLLRLSDTARQYYDLIEKAEKARLDYIIRSSELQTELGMGGGFVAARAEIERWTTDTIDALNDLARAAGRAGASERDLVNVHSVAAQRVAALIAKLKQESRDLAVTLGYITGGNGDTIESLNAQIASMGQASADTADAISQAVDGMREKMNLLLGDLSPFNDQRKLQLALEGLAAGTVDPQQVLEIGRRLYASTAQYTALFSQVMGMANFGARNAPGADTGSPAGDGRSLEELIAVRDALLAAQRPQIADQLARRLAELSFATQDSFAELAEAQGWSLQQLAADLGLSDEKLQAYLDSLVSQFGAQDWSALGDKFDDSLTRSTDRLIDALDRNLGNRIDSRSTAEREASERASREDTRISHRNEETMIAELQRNTLAVTNLAAAVRDYGPRTLTEALR